MLKQAFCNFALAGMSITEWGLVIPSPFVSLELSNSEISSYTSWTLRVQIGGDSSKQVNVAAFEALLYSAAQTTSYTSSSGIPVSFMFGWLDASGSVSDYLSYQGYTLKFDVSASGRYLTYTVTGYASMAMKASMPVLNIPAVSGFVQPSAVVEGLAKAIKADNYYELDIDHSDAPTLVNHDAMTTSFTSYVRGDKTGQDDYTTFPGLVSLSKSYNASRDAAGVKTGYKLSQLINNLKVTELSTYLKPSLTDTTPQTTSFAFWIDEPTMTQPGTIHYKDRSAMTVNSDANTLQYGTSTSNILELSGSYNGIAYNITDMSFSNLGFALDSTGETIVNPAQVTNSWPSSVANVYQTANIVNDINALASQFAGDFTVTIAGATKQYNVCQPVSLIVMSGNTLSPISGVYSITSVTHTIGVRYTTTLKLQRLSISSANQVATSSGIYSQGTTSYGNYTTTSNIISTGKVDFGELYPDWTRINTI